MIVKSCKIEAHAVALEEVFITIRRYDMRLNPEKCIFGVIGGKFRGKVQKICRKSKD